MLTLALLICLAFIPMKAAQGSDGDLLLIPIGGGYSDVYSGLCQEVVQRAENNTVKILVLPATYSSNAETISDGERQVNMTDAEQRRYEVEQACQRAAGEGVTVSAVIVPVFTRSDALLPENAALFTPDITAIFILGGDQTVAMRAIGNTPIETAMAELFAQGTIVSGTSAGGGMLAAAMLAGYNLNFAAESALKFGAADVWRAPDLHGLSFSLPNAILDQHFFQRARLGRLLNAILLPGGPHIGIGVDAYTGVKIANQQRVFGVFGLYTVMVLDAETYHAADAVSYVGEENMVSVRNVLFHLLAKNSSSYDLLTRQSSLAAAQPLLARQADFLPLPPGAGDLFLAGNLLSSLPENAILKQFEASLPAGEGNILIVATGYRSGTAANAEAKKIQNALSVPSEVIFVPADQTNGIDIPTATRGILVVGKDQSLLAPAAMTPVVSAWQQGMPLLLDNAAAAMAGAFYANHEPTPTEGEAAEAAIQRSFLQGRTKIAAGMGLIPAVFEPRLVSNNRWGRLFSLIYNHPELVGFGLQDDTAIWIKRDGASVLGSNGIFSLDLRFASLSLGENEGFEIANGMLDVFQPGEQIAYQVADAAASFEPRVTPILPTAAPTATTALTRAPTAVPPTAIIVPTATAPQIQASPTPIPAAEAPADNLPLLVFGGAALVGILVFITYRCLRKQA